MCLSSTTTQNRFTAHRRGFHLCMASARQETLNAVSDEKRGNVFTHNPLLWNPYVIQFSSYIEPALGSCLTDLRLARNTVLSTTCSYMDITHEIGKSFVSVDDKPPLFQQFHHVFQILCIDTDQAALLLDFRAEQWFEFFVVLQVL
jgi:hypothetical protein